MGLIDFEFQIKFHEELRSRPLQRCIADPVSEMLKLRNPNLSLTADQIDITSIDYKPNATNPRNMKIYGCFRCKVSDKDTYMDAMNAAKDQRKISAQFAEIAKVTKLKVGLQQFKIKWTDSMVIDESFVDKAQYHFDEYKKIKSKEKLDALKQQKESQNESANNSSDKPPADGVATETVETVDAVSTDPNGSTSNGSTSAIPTDPIDIGSSSMMPSSMMTTQTSKPTLCPDRDSNLRPQDDRDVDDIDSENDGNMEIQQMESGNVQKANDMISNGIATVSPSSVDTTLIHESTSPSSAISGVLVPGDSNISNVSGAALGPTLASPSSAHSNSDLPDTSLVTVDTMVVHEDGGDHDDESRPRTISLPAADTDEIVNISPNHREQEISDDHYVRQSVSVLSVLSVLCILSLFLVFDCLYIAKTA